jgi:cytochrome c oxidase cbb3-type subunit 1
MYLSGALIMSYNMWRTIRMPRAASAQADGTPAPRLIQAAV